ncbi:MAG: FhaA domain-containing protein [Anaerolineaceae bacterium]
MSDDVPRIEKLLEGAARRVSGGGLHPLELLQRVRSAAEASLQDGVVANDFTIRLNGGDYTAYQPTFGALQDEMRSMLDELERKRGWLRLGERRIGFVQSPEVQKGLAAVEARFSDPRHRDFAVPTGATQRIRRHRNLVLCLADGSSVALSHTPFSVGRGPGNDLVLPVLSVSRQHAEIVSTEVGLVIRDLGSRNGLVVLGARVSEHRLDGGDHVTLGDVELWLGAQ